jgi:hypothetical protein
MLRWLKTVVVSDVEKAHWMRQVGIRETTAVRGVESLFKWHQNRGAFQIPGEVWRVPMYWPGGVRHRGGVNLICGLRRERRNANVDTDCGAVWP